MVVLNEQRHVESGLYDSIDRIVENVHGVVQTFNPYGPVYLEQNFPVVLRIHTIKR